MTSSWCRCLWAGACKGVAFKVLGQLYLGSVTSVRDFVLCW